jgi:hypothetical protein
VNVAGNAGRLAKFDAVEAFQVRMNHGLMRAKLILCTVAIVCMAQTASIDPSMVRFFSGRWGCSGEFANGGKIEADLSFTQELDAHWLLYRHGDRPPGKFKALAMWGIDRESGGLISVVQLFSGDGWRDGVVTFESAAILDHKPARERFRYERQSPESFKLTYEVGTPDGRWRLGDYIVCTKSAP